MATVSPDKANADYPNFIGFDADDEWDVGSKSSPNEDYISSYWGIQIQNEILKHQELIRAGGAQQFSPELMGTPATDAAILDELNEAAVMAFVDAGDRAIILNAEVLDADTDVVIFWCGSPTSGAARWSVEYRETDDDDAMDAAWETPEAVTSTVSGVSYGQVTATVSLSGLTVGNTLMLKISRLPGHAGDTLGATAYVARVKLQAG